MMIATTISDLGTAATAGAPDNDRGTAPVAPVTGLVIGTLAGWADDGTPLVDFDGNPAQGPVAARAFAALTPADMGKMVALQFELGDIGQVAVMGVLRRSALQDGAASATAPLLPSSALQVIDNGDELRLVANRKLTLQCGRASITLDVDGSVEIRGQDVLSRAAGQNRIKGSSISLN